jgi:hypothetical protein
LVSNPIPWVIVNNLDVLFLFESAENPFGKVVLDPGFELDNDTFVSFVVLIWDFNDFFNKANAERTNLFENLLLGNGGINSWDTYCDVGLVMVHIGLI